MGQMVKRHRRPGPHSNTSSLTGWLNPIHYELAGEYGSLKPERIFNRYRLAALTITRHVAT